MIVWCKDTLAHAVLDTFIALINELVYELYTRLRQFWSWKSEEWKYKDIVQRVFFLENTVEWFEDFHLLSHGYF